MKKKLVALLMVAGMLATTLFGCSSQTGQESSTDAAAESTGETTEEADTGTETETETAAANEEDNKYIAMIALGFSHQYWQAVKQGAEEAAAELGYTITFEGPEQETMVDKQVDMLKTAIQNNPAAICMAAIDTESVASILQEEKAQGVPIVGFDAGVGEEESDVKCSTDSMAAGALAAEHAGELLGGEGKIAIIGHSQTVIDAVERVQGFKDKIESDYPNIEIVDIQYGDGDHVKSAEIAKSMVTAVPDLDLIYTSNEGSCVGAYNGLKEISKIGEVMLIGFDSSAAMKDAVRNGEIVGAITQDPIGMGRAAVESAVKLLNGEEVESFIDTGCYWYDASNMDDPEIAPLLYD